MPGRGTRHGKQAYSWYQLRQPVNRSPLPSATLDHGFASPSFGGFAIIGFNVGNVQRAKYYHDPKGISIDNRPEVSSQRSFLMSKLGNLLA